jgi:hypothetical protein
MADENQVAAAITSAAAVLKNAFGENTQVEGPNEFRYLQEQYLVELYLSELEQKDLAAFFNDIPASVSKMRSSYLPTDLVQEISLSLGSLLGETISDSAAVKESYENTFMRMMGLPKSSVLENEIEISALKSDGNLTTLPYEEIERQILDERQLPRIDRRIKITSGIHNMEDDTYENSSLNDSEVEAADDQDPITFVDNTEVQEELADSGKPNLANLESELYQYSYLLLPPVQDARISDCINEPSKIVPANFSNKRGRNINLNSLKPSMLESIIRIRKDRLSGYASLSDVEDEDGNTLEVTSDNYGVLEALFIVRIRSALKALARKMGNDIDFLREVYEQTGLLPVDKDLTTRNSTTPLDPRVSTDNAESASGSGEMAEQGFSNLEKQRIIEDSMMALLDDNSEVLDLQVQTQRSSSIKDSHVMSSLIGVIDLPRQRISFDIRKEAEDKKQKVNGPGDKKRESIDLTLGVSKGVGVVDIMVFILALFTMPESDLVGLLSDLEYERYLEEFAGSGDPSSGGIGISLGSGDADSTAKVESAAAIETLTQYIVAGYNLFNEDLKSDDSGMGN